MNRITRCQDIFQLQIYVIANGGSLVAFAANQDNGQKQQHGKTHDALNRCRKHNIEHAKNENRRHGMTR